MGPPTDFARINVDLFSIQMRAKGLNTVLLRDIPELLPVKNDVTTAYTTPTANTKAHTDVRK